jgi:biopolymer transport protein ExbD
MSVGIDYPSTTPMADERESIAPPRRRNYRPGPPDDVFIPVAPMLDMAFQLLAFFILTFKAPTAEMHVDLYLPVAAVAMPTKPEGRARPDSARIEAELENDLLIRAEADELGDLKALKLGDAPISGPDVLGDRLRRYAKILGDRPLRVRIAADDRLRYEPAARIIAACSAAGVASVRISQPGAATIGSGSKAPLPGGGP